MILSSFTPWDSSTSIALIHDPPVALRDVSSNLSLQCEPADLALDPGGGSTSLRYRLAVWHTKEGQMFVKPRLDDLTNSLG
jgi:hypothetical protein